MGSLRWAINQVNGDSSPDIIDFAINATGLQTITLGSPLPAITNSVTIEGSTQGTNAGAPLIAIDGASLSNVRLGPDRFGGLEYDPGAGDRQQPRQWHHANG